MDSSKYAPGVVWRGYSLAFTPELNLSRARAARIPASRQQTLIRAVRGAEKLWSGRIIMVAARTMPMIPWKAIE